MQNGGIAVVQGWQEPEKTGQKVPAVDRRKAVGPEAFAARIVEFRLWSPAPPKIQDPMRRGTPGGW
jgi:hypothetical protein